MVQAQNNNNILNGTSQRIDNIDNKTSLEGENEVNPFGIKLLENNLRTQIFGKVKAKPIPEEITQIAIDHLTNQNIYGKKTSEEASNVNYKFPNLEDEDIGKHFYRLGRWSSEPYKALAVAFSDVDIPKSFPKKWSLTPGWTRYDPITDEARPVGYPREDKVVFDVETLVQDGNVPVLAIAASEKFWYSWVSPYLIDPNQDRNQLIPWDSNTERVIVAHFASFDRSRIQSEYHLKNTKNMFLDTLSLHVAVGGLSSIQRNKYIKYHKALKNNTLDSLEPDDIRSISRISSVGTVNSLKEVAMHYCNITLDKQARDIFVDGNRQDVLDHFQESMNYCALDAQATHRVYKVVLKLFFEKCPHPITFAGMNIMGKAFLPVTRDWETYIESAEKCYIEMLQSVEEKLLELAKEAKKHSNPIEDPWLCHLNWSVPPLKMTKARYKKDGTFAKNGEPRPYSRQTLPNEPEWYRSLYDSTEKRVKVTTRSRIAPYLLKLKWNGYPLYYSTKYGWTYVVPKADKSETITQVPLIFIDDVDHKQYESYPNQFNSTHNFFKIPHKNGDDHNVGNPIAKGYISFFEDGTMSSEYELAQQALEMNAKCAYWISARDRVKSQFVSWQTQEGLMGIKGEEGKPHSHYGMIIPQMATMGTVTRRAVESTWMTASNAKKNRIGSELKSLVTAPPGYKIVGADVDSEELWISSLIGDSQFKEHGATAFGWMNLQGTKNEGTDLHSKTANILGISRGNAKVFNYGRIYGAGVKFAVQLLLQFNPNMSEKEAKAKAQQLYKETKGTQYYGPRGKTNKNFWYGGSESFMFNKLEEIAKSTDPRTPILNCGIPNALKPECVNDQYMTSRVNWVVQSSGVDYLHLLLVAMDYLASKYKIDARFMISVHDEIRYLVKDEDCYRAALALQISNLWTRAVFSYRLGITNLPQSVAFFSSVDIDHVLRKEVDLDCVTPSNHRPIPHGESINIHQLMEKMNGNELVYTNSRSYIKKCIKEELPPSFIEAPTSSKWSDDDILFLKKQNCTDLKKIKDLELDALTINISKIAPKSRSITSKKNPIVTKTTQPTSTRASSSHTNLTIDESSTSDKKQASPTISSRTPTPINEFTKTAASTPESSKNFYFTDGQYQEITQIHNAEGQKSLNGSKWKNGNSAIFPN